MPRYQEKLCLLRAQVIQAEEHFRGAGYNDASAGHGNRRVASRRVVEIRSSGLSGVADHVGGAIA